MYQSETAPGYVRGALARYVSNHVRWDNTCLPAQLLSTLHHVGYFRCLLHKFGAGSDNSLRSWHLPMGIGFIWPVIMATGKLFVRESPRWDYCHGNIDRARGTIARSYGTSEGHPDVQRELREIKGKLDAERAGSGKRPWYEIFTGPRMAYRTLLGITL